VQHIRKRKILICFELCTPVRYGTVQLSMRKYHTWISATRAKYPVLMVLDSTDERIKISLESLEISPSSPSESDKSTQSTHFSSKQRYIEIAHDPLLFSVAQGMTVLRETLTQNITFNRRESVLLLVLYSVVLQP
jgi:hypothetical protein